jgi:hypothetical protein
VAAILTESLIMAIAPAGRAHRLVQSGKLDAPAISARRHEIQKLLCEAPGVSNIANQVLKNSNGDDRAIRAPRSRAARPSQIDLLNLPIG